MMTAVRSYIPFISENPYSTIREHVKETIKEKQTIDKGVTAQELSASLPYGINTVTARIKELRDRDDVYVYNQRECREMDHNKDVNSYKVTWGLR